MPKFREEYQVTDRNGNPVGPVQIFEAETQKELIAKLKAAHQNSAREMYETKRKVKLGVLLEPDADQPIQSFTETALSAEERLTVKKAMDDPNKTSEGLKIILKSLGLDPDAIRALLQQKELEKRMDRATAESEKFMAAHPEYIISEYNNDTMSKYLAKHGMAVTANNLEIAYEELSDILTLQAPQQVSATPVPDTTSQNAPASDSEITNQATSDPANTEPAPAARQEIPNSSSGLSGRSSANVPATPTKTGEISLTEISRKLANMSASEYLKYIKENPDVAKKLDAASKR